MCQNYGLMLPLLAEGKARFSRDASIPRWAKVFLRYQPRLLLWIFRRFGRVAYGDGVEVLCLGELYLTATPLDEHPSEPEPPQSSAPPPRPEPPA